MAAIRTVTELHVSMNEQTTPDDLVLDDWITPREAAELTGVTPHHVRHLARTGTIEARKFGHAWMVRRASVEAYAAREHHPGPKPQESSTSD